MPASRLLVTVAEACKLVAAREADMRGILFDEGMVRETPWGARVYVPALLEWIEGLPVAMPGAVAPVGPALARVKLGG